jgi:hypothetical protein
VVIDVADTDLRVKLTFPTADRGRLVIDYPASRKDDVNAALGDLLKLRPKHSRAESNMGDPKE